MSIRVREKSAARRVTGTALVRTGQIMYPETVCQKKWTPRDGVPRQMRVSGASVKLTSNPYMDMTGADIAIPLDGLPAGPLVLAGGSTSLGPGSGLGIGYFAINSQAVRLHDFSQWNPTIAGLRVFDDIVGVDFPMSLDGYTPGFPWTHPSPDAFDFNHENRTPNCAWNSSREASYAHSQVVGTDNGVVDLAFEYENRMYAYGAFWLDTVKTEDWSYAGTTVRVNIFYNSAVGPFPTSILGVPKSAMYPVDGYQILYAMTRPQATTGLPHVDAGGTLVGISYGTYLPDVLSRVAPDVNKVIQGRTVNTDFRVETQARFANGAWRVVPRYSYSVDASTVHYYTMSSVSRSVSVGSEACYPIASAATGRPGGGPLIVDPSYFDPYEVTDSTTGCFALFAAAPTSPGSPVAGDVNSITPFQDLTAGSGYTRGKNRLPCYLGTESYIYRMTPSTVTNLSVDNRLIETHIGDTDGAGFTAEMTREEARDYRHSDDPVDVDLVPEDAKTIDVHTEQYQWAVVGGFAYSGGGDPRGQALLHTEASGAEPKIRRDLI